MVLLWRWCFGGGGGGGVLVVVEFLWGCYCAVLSEYPRHEEKPGCIHATPPLKKTIENWQISEPRS